MSDAVGRVGVDGIMGSGVLFSMDDCGCLQGFARNELVKL